MLLPPPLFTETRRNDENAPPMKIPDKVLLREGGGEEGDKYDAPDHGKFIKAMMASEHRVEREGVKEKEEDLLMAGVLLGLKAPVILVKG